MKKLLKKKTSKDATPQTSSRGSRATQQETSSIQKRLFTGVDRRSVCGHARLSSSGGPNRLSEWDRTPITGTFYRPDVQKV